MHDAVGNLLFQIAVVFFVKCVCLTVKKIDFVLFDNHIRGTVWTGLSSPCTSHRAVAFSKGQTIFCGML